VSHTLQKLSKCVAVCNASTCSVSKAIKRTV